VTTITKAPINIGPPPRVIHCEESLTIVALLVTLGCIAWMRRNVK